MGHDFHFFESPEFHLTSEMVLPDQWSITCSVEGPHQVANTPSDCLLGSFVGTSMKIGLLTIQESTFSHTSMAHIHVLHRTCWLQAWTLSAAARANSSPFLVSSANSFPTKQALIIGLVFVPLFVTAHLVPIRVAFNHVLTPLP